MTKDYECWEINGYTLEYFDDSHQYLVNGVAVPSITQILSVQFGNKYKGVSEEVLNRAAKLGTQVHQAIEDYEKKGQESNLKELRNYKFLKKLHNFEVLENEVPVILFVDDKPVAAGRMDLLIKIIASGEIFISDIKRTSGFDKEYVTMQTNLYRIAYYQSYGLLADGCSGLHLREDVRKFVRLPVNEAMAMNLVHKFLEKQNGV